jgi:hypothetical protein
MRISRRTAWSLWALTWGLVAIGLILWGHNRSALSTSSAIPALIFPVLGTLITSRDPRNRIGWIFCAIGLVDGLLMFTTQYATYGLVTEPGALPGAVAAAWTSSWIWAPPIWAIGTLCYLLFPDGRLPSYRWRPVAWLAAGGLALYIGALSLAPWPTDGAGRHSVDQALKALGTGQDIPSTVRPLFSLAVALTPSESQHSASYPLDNPLGIQGSGAMLATVASIGAVLILVSFVASVSALVLRFRHAEGRRRQQLKWVAYTAVLMALIHTVVSSWFPQLTDASLGVILSLFAAAIAIAILRYHLYDIDLVINRTVVYGLLTALLGAVYVSMVLFLGQFSGGLRGKPPTWAVAGATLMAAALFQPARHRIQQTVDRRFNRRKYQAAKTIEAFSARLREEVDLDALSAELVAVVDQTMEPTRVSLWLRPAARSPSGAPGSEARPAPWAY